MWVSGRQSDLIFIRKSPFKVKLMMAIHSMYAVWRVNMLRVNMIVHGTVGQEQASF